jgi:hypothetical protein
MWPFRRKKKRGPEIGPRWRFAACAFLGKPDGVQLADEHPGFETLLRTRLGSRTETNVAGIRFDVHEMAREFSNAMLGNDPSRWPSYEDAAYVIQYLAGNTPCEHEYEYEQCLSVGRSGVRAVNVCVKCGALEPEAKGSSDG